MVVLVAWLRSGTCTKYSSCIWVIKPLEMIPVWVTSCIWLYRTCTTGRNWEMGFREVIMYIAVAVALVAVAVGVANRSAIGKQVPLGSVVVSRGISTHGIMIIEVVTDSATVYVLCLALISSGNHYLYGNIGTITDSWWRTESHMWTYHKIRPDGISKNGTIVCGMAYGKSGCGFW